MNACENGKRTNNRVMGCVGAMKGVGHPNSCIVGGHGRTSMHMK